MDILSPTYSPAEGVARPVHIAPEPDTDGIDLDADGGWGIEDIDPNAALRAGIADAERALHDLGMTLMSDDIEARIAAMYALTDLSDRLADLRFGIELGAGWTR